MNPAKYEEAYEEAKRGYARLAITAAIAILFLTGIGMVQSCTSAEANPREIEAVSAT